MKSQTKIGMTTRSKRGLPTSAIAGETKKAKQVTLNSTTNVNNQLISNNKRVDYQIYCYNLV